MAANLAPKPLAALTGIRRVKGQPGDRYEVIFVDQHDRIVVGLTEWYRVRKAQGSSTTCATYLTYLLPFFTFLIEQEIPWNASPERLRPALIAFHRDRLGCLIQPTQEQEGVEIVPTRETSVRDSTLRVLRAALRDFYLVMRDQELYAFPNPLTSETLMRLKRLRNRTIANVGAPDHSGIRGESHAQSRRQPTAFLRHPSAQEWKPDLRKELADVRVGIHAVLDAMLGSSRVSPREKAVLQVLRNTGARLHEIVLMTVGGYRSEGIAGQARVIDKGSHGREIKTIYFSHNPRVQEALNTYIDKVRPQQDPAGRRRLADVGGAEPFFLTGRGTPYTVKHFYYYWYKHYPSFQTLCPVRFSPHDIRHLFITEFLIFLRLECGAGTENFDAERYLREREAFGRQTMGWRSAATIDIYDHTRDKEGHLAVLAQLQRDYSQQRYLSESSLQAHDRMTSTNSLAQEQTSAMRAPEGEATWLHDAETLAWVKRLQHQHQRGGHDESTESGQE